MDGVNPVRREYLRCRNSLVVPGESFRDAWDGCLMLTWHPMNKLRIHMPIEAVLEGTVAVVQDDAETARRLELALAQAGAAVFKTTAVRETLDFMWSHKPAAVIIDPGPDNVGALFLAAQAKEQGIAVIHYSDDSGDIPRDVSISRSKPASAVVEAVVSRIARRDP